MKSKTLKTMKTRPEISDAEIQEMMDFNNLLDQHKDLTKPGGSKWIYGVGAGVVILSLIGWLMIDRDTVTKTPEPPPTVIENKPTVEPQPEAPVEEVKPDVKIKQQAPVATKPENVEPDVPKADVYVEAQPVNGYPDLYAYFQKELTYPVEAVKDSIEGIVSISFVINREGKPEHIKIENSLGTAFDNEAIRVISGMPAWKAASLNGKPMPAKISVPLTFQINRESK